LIAPLAASIDEGVTTGAMVPRSRKHIAPGRFLHFYSRCGAQPDADFAHRWDS
jgi:hypothetical protein